MFRDTQEVWAVVELDWQQVREALNSPWWQKIVLTFFYRFLCLGTHRKCRT
jgi:hypothetical protein